MMHKPNHHKSLTLFKGIPSLSGSIACIAIKTSAGVSIGPDCDDPCIRMCSQFKTIFSY